VDRGRIYYVPEIVTVHLARRQLLRNAHRKVVMEKELDLRRFMEK
jgi:hypothetical protein